MSRFFIDRPIFAAVLSIVIVIVGGVAVVKLPVAQYPEVVPPTISVTANYPGANALDVAENVATPIEEQVNGVENMIYMLSKCTNDGQMTLDVTFKPGTDLNMAQVLVQNRVAIAEAKLPEEVKRQGVTTKKRSPSILLVVNLIDVVRPKDGIELGARNYDINTYLDGQPAVSLATRQLPGSNALETAAALKEAMKTLAESFPKGMKYRIVYDTTVFIDESIH